IDVVFVDQDPAKKPCPLATNIDSLRCPEKQEDGQPDTSEGDDRRDAHQPQFEPGSVLARRRLPLLRSAGALRKTETRGCRGTSRDRRHVAGEKTRFEKREEPIRSAERMRQTEVTRQDRANR